MQSETITNILITITSIHYFNKEHYAALTMKNFRC